MIGFRSVEILSKTSCHGRIQLAEDAATNIRDAAGFAVDNAERPVVFSPDDVSRSSRNDRHLFTWEGVMNARICGADSRSAAAQHSMNLKQKI